MKNTKQFLIISAIVHLMIFIVLALIVLPPVEKAKDGLFLEFIMKAYPVARKRPPPAKVEPEPEEKVEEKPETPEVTKPPEPETFSHPPALEEPADTLARAVSNETAAERRTLVKKPEREGMVLTKPMAQKPIPLSTDDESIVVASNLYEDKGDIADSSGTKGFSGSRVGPIGSRPGAKGESEQYIYPGGAVQPLKRPGKFGEILPELARGITNRATGDKIDIVFLIDTTGSMRDNVRGVKDHIEHFLQPLEEKEIDAALGLVEFADQDVRDAKVVGLTRSQKKFEKWLDKTRFYGGADIAESGYEALIAALEQMEFRDGAEKSFIFISDAPQHDFDYDGRSRYSLDRIIARLSDEGVIMDVVGVKYLSMKQLAWGTGGKWKHIPGGDPLMDIPQPTSSMIRSRLGRSLPPALVEDRVTIEFNDPVPDWVDLSYKVLDPRGLKRLGTLTYRIKVDEKTERMVEFSPKLDLRESGDQPGTYTLIYRIRDSMGHRDILRRTFELQRANS